MRSRVLNQDGSLEGQGEIERQYVIPTVVPPGRTDVSEQECPHCQPIVYDRCVHLDFLGVPRK
jgi:hypothetical protein